jgi:ABC superfamily ATP binding cassette transporter solute-binding protein
VADYAAKQTNGAVVAVGELVDPATQAIVINKNDAATTQAVQKAMQYLIDKGVWNQILTAWGIDTSQALKTATINPAE